MFCLVIAVSQSACLQGILAIPMTEVIQKKIIKNTFRLDAAKHGQLQMQLRWMSVLQGF